MAGYYNPKRSDDWNYGGKNWKLSRSKIDFFQECQRCFYIDNKYGVSRPKMPAFTLNVAVDALLKKEFDIHRAKKTSHPLMKKYGVEAIPYSHPEIDSWRENFVGIQYRHEPTDMLITGAIDDVWINPAGELIVVDYKATSKDGKIDSLDNSDWKNQYQRQLEVYQWLLRRKGFEVSSIGYFVYANGQKDRKAFDGQLEFEITLIPHKGDDGWVEKTILNIKKCLDDKHCPSPSKTCDYCAYRLAMQNALKTAKGE